MVVPFFYIAAWSTGEREITLDEDNSRHVIQVLRMRPGEALRLTDGKGALLEAVILDDHKKKCRVTITTETTAPPPPNRVTVAISPVKNTSRFEWFLEKATEVGVSAIIPLLCERTERQSIRTDRLGNILVSAMLQSQQAWLPVLSEPTPLSQLLGQTPAGQAYIAHLLEEPRPTASLTSLIREHAPGANTGETHRGPSNALILIGPEGDFTPKEVEAALAAKFLPVSLGHNRLRTETAGIVAATLLCIR
jgi:16S rRNA (uracil1498-N3)-methyltransferase